MVHILMCMLQVKSVGDNAACSVSSVPLYLLEMDFAGFLLFNKMVIMKFYLPVLPPNYVTLPNSALSQLCLPVYVVSQIMLLLCLPVLIVSCQPNIASLCLTVNVVSQKVLLFTCQCMFSARWCFILSASQIMSRFCLSVYVGNYIVQVKFFHRRLT